MLFSLFFFTLCLSVSSSNSIIHYMVCVLFSDHFTSSDFLFSALPPSIRGHTHTHSAAVVCTNGAGVKIEQVSLRMIG